MAEKFSPDIVDNLILCFSLDILIRNVFGRFIVFS